MRTGGLSGFGPGYALCSNRLINVSGDSALCFRPLIPEMRAQGTLIWKRYQVLSPAARLFAACLRKSLRA